MMMMMRVAHSSTFYEVERLFVAPSCSCMLEATLYCAVSISKLWLALGVKAMREISDCDSLPGLSSIF